MSYWKYALLACTVFIFLLNYKSYNTAPSVTQEDIESLYLIDRLSSEPYYFPAKKPGGIVEYQTLERFDLIFVGYDSSLNDKIEDAKALSQGIPGVYSHMLSYLGKDSDGFAYALEMNADKDKSLTISRKGLSVGGRLYVYCLGKDFNSKLCPEDRYIYGIESYDFMWAKRLKPELRSQILLKEDSILARIKQDLLESHPFQLPFQITLETPAIKTVSIINDGFENGSDCTSYYVSLFEAVAGVCLDEIHMRAKDLEFYYLNDSIGQQAVIPKRYNPFFEEDVSIKHLLGESGYSIVDNEPRKTQCLDRRTFQGLSTPELVFNSPSLVDIPISE